MSCETKKPCVRCGASEFGKKGECKPCKRAADAAYGARNREKKAAYDAARYQSNKDSICKKAAQYRALHSEEITEWRRDHYQRNKGKINASSAAYYRFNTDKVVARVAAYRAANPEKVAALRSKWVKANPNLVNLYSRNRRARVKNASGKLSREIEAKLFRLQRGRCACCGKPLGSDYHIDHVMPLVLGGENTDSNVQLLRARCNHQKNGKHPVDFMRSRGFLL